MPIDSAPPCAHAVLHYPQLAMLFGVLKWFWLMVFERFNQKIKGLVGNAKFPISSVVNAMKRDSGYIITIHLLNPTVNTTVSTTHINSYIFPKLA